MNNMNYAATWKSILGLTATGFVGMLVFVAILTVIWPVLLIAGIWLFIQKIKFNQMLRKAARDGQMAGYADGEAGQANGTFSRHIDVTVVDESGKVL